MKPPSVTSTWSFKYLQVWPLHHFPGQPATMLKNPFGEETFSNMQSKAPLAQFEAFPLVPDLIT